MASPLWLVVAVSLALLISSTTAYSGKVLLVSFDGFRWDYLNKIPGLVNFERMKKEGVSVTYMNSTFSTVTFPNHYSIATGLYQETHGIVLNHMYDPDLNAWFKKGRSTVPDIPWWDGGEPIWVTAEKQNKTAGVCFWAGGSEAIRGVRPSYNVPWQREYGWDLKVEDAITWFKDDDVDVALLYHNQPDESGHHHGPFSQQTNDSVRTVDQNLGVLLDALDNNGLSESVNLLVVSDHGMATVHKSRLVDLHDFIDKSDYKVLLDANSVCMILPNEGKKEEVYEKLHGGHPNMTVWYREDLPEHWHYKRHRRIFPIVIVMDEGWQCVKNASDPWFHKATDYGAHGYDNAAMSMKAIFLARGPDFKHDYLSNKPISNLDIYPLISQLLGITPAPNNGSLARTLPFLRPRKLQEVFHFAHGMQMQSSVLVLLGGVLAWSLTGYC